MFSIFVQEKEDREKRKAEYEEKGYKFGQMHTDNDEVVDDITIRMPIDQEKISSIREALLEAMLAIFMLEVL